jgi:hypothetical protein
MKAVWSLVVIAGLGAAGCASDEPRQLERDDDELGQVEEDRAGGTFEGSGGAAGQTGQTARTDQQVGTSQQAGLLDGKTYQVELQGKDGEDISDTLIFQRGTFDSTACRQYGFSAVPYQATRQDDGSIKFQALAKSGEASNQWNGVVKGDSIEGTVSMKKPGGEACDCSFKGSVGAPTQGEAGWQQPSQQGHGAGESIGHDELNEENK